MSKLVAHILLMSLLLAAVPVEAEPVVPTTSGQIQGATQKDGDSFLGIPFAASPTGDLRWRVPQPVPAWEGIRKAVAFGKSCPQPRESPTQLSPLGPTDEDCLYLNVWRPAKIGTKPLPVFVWIHGGGFIAGAGSEEVFDSKGLVQRGVILVTANYRLGRLGFFAHPALAREHPNEPTGNFGYLDQIAALKWIQDNIAHFGGDPNNVTVAGESAGAISVIALTASPMADGLIDKGIVQSGVGMMGPPRFISADQPERLSAMTFGARWAKSLGIDGDDAAAAQALRALPVETVSPSAPTLEQIMGILNNSGPMIDGQILTEPPEIAIREGRAKHIPMIFGNNSLESEIWSFGKEGLGLVRLARPVVEDELLRGLSQSARDKLVGEYLVAARGDRAAALALVATALQQGLAARDLVAASAKYQPTFLYRFEAVPTPGRAVAAGSPHGTDIFYMFSSLDKFRSQPDQMSATDLAVASMMTDYWASFARKGVPHSRQGARWDRYDPATEQLLLVTNNGSVTTRTPNLDLLLEVKARQAAE